MLARVKLLRTSSRMALRFLSTGNTSPKEMQMRDLLQSSLNCTNVVVRDVSGGCGAMYEIEVESPAFSGLSLVKQHRLVTEVRNCFYYA